MTQTVGSQTSSFPASLPAITAQDESNDPVAEDPEVAEARDLNLVISELQAVAHAIGATGRGEVTVDEGVPDCDIEDLTLQFGGTLVTYAGATGVVLSTGAVNSIYLDLSLTTPAEAVAASFPDPADVPHVPLAVWDDSGGSPTFADKRPAALVVDGPAFHVTITDPGGTPTAEVTKGRILKGQTLTEVAATVGHSLSAGSVNYIYLDVEASPPAVASNATGFPTDGRHVPLAVWDDSGGSPTFADKRPTSIVAHPNEGDADLADGQACEIDSATTELTGISGATATASSLIPAGCLLVGVSIRVTTTITGTVTDFDVGDGSDVDAFGAAIALTAGTTTDLTDVTQASPGYYTSATDVVLTANGGTFSTGDVRVTAHFVKITAATS